MLVDCQLGSRWDAAQMKELRGNWAEQIRKSEKLVLARSHSEISSRFLVNLTVLGGEATQSRIPGAATVGFVPLQNGQTHVNYGLQCWFLDLRSLLDLAVTAAFRKR